MDGDPLEAWREEEARAFRGWDFAHLNGRWEGGELPWDYKGLVLSHLWPHYLILDMGTGGGEFLLTLEHPYVNTSVTEGYPLNVRLCEQTLAPLGITVRQVFDDGRLPYEDGAFDMVINPHESFDAGEVMRALRPGGLFITQQVGGQNDRDLSTRLIDGFVPPYPEHDLEHSLSALTKAGFQILESGEAFPVTCFFDVGAVVYYAKVIEWEFPGFTVDRCFPKLRSLQEELSRDGCISATEHRFYLVAQKP